MLARGIEFNARAEAIKAKGSAAKVVSGDDAFFLYD